MPVAATPLSFLGHAHTSASLFTLLQGILYPKLYIRFTSANKAKMHAVKFALAALAATAVQASAIDGDEVFAVLLKRQEPGTPAYNCHDNCG